MSLAVLAVVLRTASLRADRTALRARQTHTHTDRGESVRTHTSAPARHGEIDAVAGYSVIFGLTSACYRHNGTLKRQFNFLFVDTGTERLLCSLSLRYIQSGIRKFREIISL